MTRIFVASPRDVALERSQVAELVLRLNGEFGWIDRFEAVLWEEGHYKASRTFQPQINEALEPCEIVIAILGMRIGTQVEDDFPLLPDGSRYPSGTGYEILASLDRAERTGKPDVFVFFKGEKTAFKITRPDAAAEAMEQWNRLSAFRRLYFESPDGRSIRAFNSFDEPAEFAEKIDKLLRNWIRMRHGDRPGVTWSIARQGSPFPGLEAFDARHADVFCGRDRKVARAIEALTQAANGLRAGRQRRPFLLIVGPSGAGKSSLMRAGLAPRLARPGVISEVGAWRIAAARPGEGATIFHALAQALLVRGEGDDPGGFGRALPELGAIFAAGRDAEKPIETLVGLMATAGPEVVVPIVLAALDRAADADRLRESRFEPRQINLLLLIDQFEDLLADGIDPQARARFAQLIAALTDSGRVWTAATLRADLYGNLIAERPLIALTDLGAEYALAPPGEVELEEIVMESAARSGLSFEADTQGNRLEDKLLKDCAGGDVLPLLQFTLSRLFELGTPHEGGKRLTFEAYASLDGVDGAIEQTAKTATRGFGEDERAALRRLFRALVVPIAGAAAATGAKALALRAFPRGALPATPAMTRVVEALLKARILQSSLVRIESDEDGHPGGSVAMLRVAHERVLASWAEAREIVEENRDFFRMRAEIEDRWAAWTAENEQEDYLLAPGRPVAEAERFLEKDTGGELPETLHAFVARSVVRERERTRAETARARLMRRLRASAYVLGGAAAVLAVFALLQWDQARGVASAAKGTVGKLVGTFGKDLSERDGVPPGLVNTSLRQVDGLVDDLQQKIGGDDDLERARAEMLFHFASAYKRAGGGDEAAFKTARRSLDMREALLRRHEGDLDIEAERAEGYDLLGDLLRRANKPEEALGDFRQAQDIRIGLARATNGQRQPELRDKRLIMVSKSFVRIGDVFAQRSPPDKTMARAAYGSALSIAAYLVAMRTGPSAALPVFTAAPNEAAAAQTTALWRELSWPYKKLGTLDLKDDPNRARETFEKALCLRRAVAVRSDQIEPQRDIGHSLRDLGLVYEAMYEKHLDDTGQTKAMLVFMEALSIREGLHRRNPDSADIQADLAQSLFELGTRLDQIGEPAAALDLFDNAARLRRQLARLYPTNASYAAEQRLGGAAFDSVCAKLTKSEPDFEKDCRPAPPNTPRLPPRLSGAYEKMAERFLATQGGRHAEPVDCLGAILQGLGAIAGDPEEPWKPASQTVPR